MIGFGKKNVMAENGGEMRSVRKSEGVDDDEKSEIFVSGQSGNLKHEKSEKRGEIATFCFSLSGAIVWPSVGSCGVDRQGRYGTATNGWPNNSYFWRAKGRTAQAAIHL